VDSYACRLSAAIEQPDGPGAILEFFCIDPSIAGTCNAPCLPAKRILIDGQHFVVGEQTNRERIELLEIAADEERAGEQAPERQVRVLFVGRQAAAVRTSPARLEPCLTSVKSTGCESKIAWQDRSTHPPALFAAIQ
jgi:hypothetical protein